MRVLLLGATGNLGRRLLPALLAHNHHVVAYVRAVDKLRSLITPALFERLDIYEGDALDTAAVEDAIRRYSCDAIMNTSGTRLPGREQMFGKIATSVSSAAIRVGKERGRPLRAWLIGGLGSLQYPNSGGWAIQDYLPDWMSRHLREVEQVMKTIPTADLKWSLLCVAFMTAKSDKIDLLGAPEHHGLVLTTRSAPEWQDSWLRYVPFLGDYLNVFANILPYSTRLEDVADFIAEDFEGGGTSVFVGELVGMKQRSKPKGP